MISVSAYETDIRQAVRAVAAPQMRLVANVGDFGPAYAAALKEAGFTGVYHIHRLREGTDTNARPQARIRTMDACAGQGWSCIIV